MEESLGTRRLSGTGTQDGKRRGVGNLRGDQKPRGGEIPEKGFGVGRLRGGGDAGWGDLEAGERLRVGRLRATERLGVRRLRGGAETRGGDAQGRCKDSGKVESLGREREPGWRRLRGGGRLGGEVSGERQTWGRERLGEKESLDGDRLGKIGPLDGEE